MKHSLSIFVLFLSLLIVSCGISPQPDNRIQDSIGSPNLVADSAHYEFGKVSEGEILTHSYSIKNIGDADALITDAKVSCGCTEPKYPKKVIRPGEKIWIDVSFKSAGYKGTQYKTVRIYTNAKKEPFQLSFSADVE